MASGYRLGRRLKAGRKGVLDFLTYLSTIPGAIAGGEPEPSPTRFEVGDWTVEPDGSDAVTVEILTLSDTGITDIEYSVDGGLWISSGINTVDIFTIPDLVAATEYEVELRPINSGGAGLKSDMKLVTTD